MFQKLFALLALDDVTTTPEDPPRFRALERESFNVNRDMSYPASYIELQKGAYPGLKPLKSDLSPAQAFELVEAAAIENSRWDIIAVEIDRLQLEAVASARVPFLQDDVIVQVRADGSGSAIHMRCKSRLGRKMGRTLGRTVWGDPAPRITAFFKRLEAKMV